MAVRPRQRLAAVDPAPGGPPRGTPVEASWDPALGAAMRHAARVVEEERVIGDLIGDLAD